MKRITFKGMLGLEAVLCLLLFLVKEKLPAVITSIVAFPFEQIGLLLRALSLAGSLGNILAWILYVLICLSPLVVLYFMRKRDGTHKEDILLMVLCGVLFGVLYYMINPLRMGGALSSDDMTMVGRAFLSGTFYSVLIAYLVLRTLRTFYDSGMEKIQKYLILLLSVLNVYFVFYVFGLAFGGFLEARQTLYAGNTGAGSEILLSEVFLFLQYAVMALPYFLNIFVVFSIIGLLREMTLDRYSEATTEGVRNLSRLCRWTLTVTVLTNMGFHILQLMFSSQIRALNSTLGIPVFSLVFVLAVLMLTQFVQENKALKDDNDMFI